MKPERLIDKVLMSMPTLMGVIGGSRHGGDGGVREPEVPVDVRVSPGRL